MRHPRPVGVAVAVGMVVAIGLVAPSLGPGVASAEQDQKVSGAAAARAPLRDADEPETGTLAVVGRLDLRGDGREVIATDRPVLDFDWGVSRPGDTSTGQATGKAQYQPLTITAHLDTASVKLFAALVANKTLFGVDLGLIRPGETDPYMTVSLTGARIGELHAEADGSSLLHRVSFRYLGITWSTDGATATDKVFSQL